jgi:hypothetical protein
VTAPQMMTVRWLRSLLDDADPNALVCSVGDDGRLGSVHVEDRGVVVTVESTPLIRAWLTEMQLAAVEEREAE